VPTKTESCSAILAELRKQGDASYRRTMIRHGAQEPIFGVKIEYLKKIQKRIKKDDRLAKELFDSGNYDAMYLAGLIADDHKMSKTDLDRWLKKASSPGIAEFIVPWVAAGSRHGWELGLKWIESSEERIAAAGWSTLCSVVAITDDEHLDLGGLKKLVVRIAKSIHEQPNRVRYWQNQFLIACGSYVAPLTQECLKAADAIGKVFVDMGDTACKVPDATAYIGKVKSRGSIGKKRASPKC
jgi:3-methyladenine DNA glycosylase AlkD